MKLIKITFLLFKQIFSFGVYAISFLFPRNKKIWIYGNGKGGFRDNAKYFFIYNSKNFPEIKHIWISESQQVVKELTTLGFVAIYKFSFQAFLLALTAKVYIYNGAPTDTVHGCMRGTAFCFNLWHGVPFKKIEYDITKGSFYKSFFNPQTVFERFESFLFEPKAFRSSDSVLAPSPKLVPIFSSAFKLPAKSVFVGPYPRNEILKLSVKELQFFIDKYESKSFKYLCGQIIKFKTVIIYMPTFRDNNHDFMSFAIPDYEKLQNVCEKNDTLFLIKAHPATVFKTDLSTYKNIMSLDKQIDIYPLLPLTHALVSDYSSIFFDYSIIEKKMIFYAFDKEEYFKDNRDAYFEYEAVFSKDISNNFEDLLKEISLTNANGKHVYPLSRTFVENNNSMADITNHLKSSVQ